MQACPLRIYGQACFGFNFVQILQLNYSPLTLTPVGVDLQSAPNEYIDFFS